MPINKTNKKKNGLQGYRVRVNYTDMNGNPQQVERMAYGLSEAQLLEKQLLIEFKERKEISKSKVTINQLVEEYGEYHKIEVKLAEICKQASKFKSPFTARPNRKFARNCRRSLPIWITECSPNRPNSRLGNGLIYFFRNTTKTSRSSLKNPMRFTVQIT